MIIHRVMTAQQYVLALIYRAQQLEGAEAQSALLGINCIGLVSRKAYSYTEPLPTTEDVGIHGWTEFAYYTGVWKAEKRHANMRYVIIPASVRLAIIQRAEYTGESLLLCKPAAQVEAEVAAQTAQAQPTARIIDDDSIAWPNNW